MGRLRLRLATLEDRLAPSATQVADINRQIVNADPVDPLVVVDGQLIFEGLGAGTDPAIWRSDGTLQGTGPAPGVRVETTTPGVDFAGAHFFAGTNPAGVRGLWRTDGTADGTRPVRHFGPGVSGLPPTHLTVAGDTLFFTVDGNQLWKSDGTTAGTVWVKTFGTQIVWDDVTAGPVIGPVAAVGNRVFFALFDPARGHQLWVSDGAPAGTQQVFDLNASPPITLLGAVGNELLFSAWPEGASQFQLWKSDGTPAGTRVVRDDVRPLRPVASFGGALYFAAHDGVHGDELWTSNGTAIGTRMVEDIHPTGSGQPLEPVEYGGYLYFTATDTTAGREVWRTDGTETVRVTDLRPGPPSSDPKFLVAGADGVYFAANDGVAGVEVWKTDGTATVLVADLHAGPDSSFPTWLTAGVGGPTGVFFVANPLADGPALYIARPDGSVERLAAAWAKTGHTFPTPGVTAGGAHYFYLTVPPSTAQIWRTDGTAGGTQLLAEIPGGAFFNNPNEFVAVGDTVYFAATHPDFGRELWTTDGTPQGTRVVKNIEPESPTSRHSNPEDLIAFQGKVIFTARTAADGRELWVSDGTLDGTQMVADLYPGTGDAFPNRPLFTELNGFLYFRARDPVRGEELWRTDGTPEGTTLVTDLPDPWVGLSGVGTYQHRRIGDRLFFRGQDAVDGAGLYVTDGTPAGTTRVSDLNDGFGAWGQVDDRLLYWDADPAYGPMTLWATDGTPGGSVMLLRALPSTAFVTAGGLAYFTTGENPLVQELWRTDGTPGGTRRVMIFPREIVDPTVLNDRLYFVGYDLARGWGLWTSDGTTAGTRLVVDPIVGIAPAFDPPNLHVAAGSLFLGVTTFTAQPSVVENHLWRSDGTTAGTRKVASDRGNRWEPFAEVNGVPLFEHDNGVTGNELWRYDPVVAAPDLYQLEDHTRLDVPAASGVLANDTDGGELPLTAKLVSKPKAGWLTLRPDGSFSYRPFNTDFSGTDTFTYRAAGAVDQSPVTTVSINVDLTNQAPTPADDTASGQTGRPLTVRVLANDADPDQDTLSIASFTQGTGGRVTRMGNALVYTPRVGAPPTDTFTYTVTDKRGATATATVIVHLAATAPPKVQAVRLFPGPGTGSINLTTLGGRSLPFGHLLRLEVTFTGDVSVSADDLRLFGMAGGAYSLSGFAYNAATRTASWAIDGPATSVASDRLLVSIDGVTAAVPLTTWAKTVSVLVGDVDGNGLVTAADVAGVRSRFGSVDGARRLFHDLDGNGVVDAADVDLAAANVGTRRA